MKHQDASEFLQITQLKSVLEEELVLLLMFVPLVTLDGLVHNVKDQSVLDL